MNHFNEFKNNLTADNAFGFLDQAVKSSQTFNPKIISNVGSETMLQAIRAELKRSKSFIFSVAFVTPSSIIRLKQNFLDFSGTGLILTSTYLGFNSPAAFRELLNIPNVKVRILNNEENFHAKGYIFEQFGGTTAIIGSSNLSDAALITNREWNIKFSALPDGDVVYQLQREILEQQQRSFVLTEEWISEYEKTYIPPARRAIPTPEKDNFEIAVDSFQKPSAIKPNLMQQDALKRIAKVRKNGGTKAIVVSATGTGKTILSALDVKSFAPKKFLFLVHREQILDKAIEEFQKVLLFESTEAGKFAGSDRKLDNKYVFATIQSFSKEENLKKIAPNMFDYVVIDEVHKAGSKSYERVIDFLEPEFLLGFTATPERTDGVNIFEKFDYNLAYEIRLQQALEQGMLVPFHYFGVTDFEYENGEVVTDATALTKLVVPERVDHILKYLHSHGQAGERIRGLIFCSRKEEARQLEEELNKRTLRGKQLRTRSLTGEDSVEVREDAVKELEQGDLDYLITVDVFNEGIDIPTVNQVVMLRQTKSSIIFTQQLGRGLRKSADKNFLVVIDFIGNYANNFLIPIALLGDTSHNKDTLRKKMIDSAETGAISGVSSISFDEISKQRIYSSLAKTKLDSMQNLKKIYSDLEFKLGRPPRLIDFATHGTIDPLVLANAQKNYWNFLKKVKATKAQLTDYENALLTFVTRELMNGKRPHELLVLRELLQGRTFSLEELKQFLSQNECTNDDLTINSVLNVLDLSFFTEPQQKTYGSLPVAGLEADALKASEIAFTAYQSNKHFAEFVDDVLKTGLYISRHIYNWSQTLVSGHRYSRKDVCRLLGWESNQEGTIFGYKLDYSTGTCPLFITYNKKDDISESTNYGDEFSSESVVRWFTRSRNNLDSKEVKPIVANAIDLHVFAKKDDAEGIDFFYLGQAKSSNPEETTMQSKGKELPVVTMDLILDSPMEISLFDYFTQKVN